MNFSAFPKIVRVRFVELLVNQTLNFMIAPFMALYLSRRYGETTSGILMSFAFGGALVSTLFGGYLSDIWGKTRLVIGCEVVRVLGFLIMLASMLLDVPSGVLLGFAVIYTAGGAAYPAIQALIIEHCPAEQRKGVYLCEFVLFNAAVALGALVGAALFDRHPNVIFVVGASASFALAVTFKRTLAGAVEAALKPVRLLAVFPHYVPVLKDRTFVLFLIGSVLALVTERVAFNALSVTLTTEHVSTFGILERLGYRDISGLTVYSWLVAASSLTVMLFGIPASLISKRLGNGYRAMLIGIVVTGIAYAITVEVREPLVLLLLVFVASVGELIFWPIRQSALADVTVEAKRGAYMAANSLVTRAAFALGPFAIVVGAVASNALVVVLVIICTILSLLAFAYVRAQAKVWR